MLLLRNFLNMAFSLCAWFGGYCRLNHFINLPSYGVTAVPADCSTAVHGILNFAHCAAADIIIDVNHKYFVAQVYFSLVEFVHFIGHALMFGQMVRGEFASRRTIPSREKMQPHRNRLFFPFN